MVVYWSSAVVDVGVAERGSAACVETSVSVLVAPGALMEAFKALK